MSNLLFNFYSYFLLSAPCLQNIEFEEASQEDPLTEVIRLSNQDLSQQPIKRPKLNPENDSVKILNRSYKKGSESISSVRTVKVLNVCPSPKVTSASAAPVVLQKVVLKKKIPVKKEIVPEVKETVVAEVYHDSDVIEEASIADLPIVTEDNTLVTQEIPVKPTVDESVYAKKLEDQSKQIEELKQLILENMSQKPVPPAPVPVPTCESPKMEKSQMNKVQLFNGIKRYLNPSMVAMLRMEMFGGNDRQYKPDEKTVCTELLALGTEVYKFFADEYRFRLPPIKEVQKWEQDKIEDDLENL